MTDDALYGSYSDEEWRPVEGYPYSVSNKGRVRRDGAARGATVGKILREGRHPFGYPTVVLCNGPGRIKNFPVHALVATAFHGPRPKGKECAHLDGSRTGNTPENLAWVTRKENIKHAARHGTQARGETHGHSRLTEMDILAIRAMAAAGWSQSKIARFYKITQQYISKITNRRTWRHV